MAKGLDLAMGLVVLVGLGVAPFLAREELLPKSITRHGPVMDFQINLTLWMVAGMFVVLQLVLAWMILRYRERGQAARYIHGRTWFFPVLVLLLIVGVDGVNMAGQSVWTEMHMRERIPDAETVQLEVEGRQFKWYFRYPGNDGTYGNRSAETAAKDPSNFMGLDWEHDPDSRDDIVEGTMKVPYDADVILKIRGRDVLHSFFVRELRVKQDCVPGLETKIPFHIERTRLHRVDLDSTALRSLEDEDLTALRFAFEKKGLPLGDRIEVSTAADRLLAELKSRLVQVDDLQIDKIRQTLAGAWIVTDRVVSPYDPAGPGFPVCYRVEQSTEGLRVYRTTFEVVCAELCGQGHYQMRGVMDVVSPEEFKIWSRCLSEQAASYH